MNLGDLLEYVTDNKEISIIGFSVVVFLIIIFYLTRSRKTLKKSIDIHTEPANDLRIYTASDATEYINLRFADIVIFPDYFTKPTMKFNYFMDSSSSSSVVVRNETDHQITITDYNIPYYYIFSQLALGEKNTDIIFPRPSSIPDIILDRSTTYKFIYNNGKWTSSVF